MCTVHIYIYMKPLTALAVALLGGLSPVCSGWLLAGSWLVWLGR